MSSANPGVPDFATHYHLHDKQPFLNLSELTQEDLSVVLGDLELRRADKGLHRVFGRRYMELRRLTEERLFQLFVEAGGQPERKSPHYFVLGESDWYRGLAPGTREIAVPLSELPSGVTSFTYPDSFTAMGYLPRFGLPYEPKPYHGRVFRMSHLASVIQGYGLPSDSGEEPYAGYQHRPFEKYIEIQVWSDEPIRPYR